MRRKQRKTAIKDMAIHSQCIFATFARNDRSRAAVKKNRSQLNRSRTEASLSEQFSGLGILSMKGSPRQFWMSQTTASAIGVQKLSTTLAATADGSRFRADTTCLRTKLVNF